MKIIIDDKIPFIRGILEPQARVLYLPGGQIKPEDVVDADALVVRTRTRVNKALLRDSKVSFVASATIGYDHIDREYLSLSGIKWTNCPGCNAESVAQYITAVFVELAEKYSITLHGKVLGVIGAGNVGSRVIKKALALGMKALVNDPPRAEREGNDGFTDLEGVIGKSDFITLHVPLLREGKHKTFHLANRMFFETMKPEAFIINTSRGEILCNADLKTALRKKIICGAVLDVWENEPGIDGELLSLVDIATSHIAGYSADGKSNGTAMSVQALSRFFHLGLDTWYPGNIPMSDPIIRNTEKGMEGIRQAVRATYDIFSDDRPLRNNPGSFEYNRDNYHNRREFHNYTVKISDRETCEVLGKLGFKTLSV
ncbi:MAG: 4-phosphoerythronate dehydrogenase [Candidatus Brocadiaceae bacterium]|nr:4-phosphoerythronate dehydrogenase [Candidatus Brocadiaceae bacterium]